jgi:hypothetical protein
MIIFKEIRRRLSIFVHETCHCLSWDNRFRQIVSQFGLYFILKIFFFKLNLLFFFSSYA